MKPSILSTNVAKRLLAAANEEAAIIVGNDALTNLRASLAHARLLVDKRLYDSVIYINLPFSKRRFTDERMRSYGDTTASLEIHHISTGHLSQFIDGLSMSVTPRGKTAIIINSWEMASANYRYKEELIFLLLRLVNDENTTVFVYTTANANGLAPGKPNRCGLGKLSLMTSDVIKLDTEDPAEPVREIRSESTKHSPTHINQDGECVILDDRNINDLAYADDHQSGVGDEESLVFSQ
jgi:hypothetical protein